MKMLVKLFIYWTIIAIIGVFHNAATVEAKPRSVGGMSGLMMRNAVAAKSADEGDIPQELAATNLRVRRESPPEEVPQELQKQIRAKRQMPSPPDGVPMPPM